MNSDLKQLIRLQSIDLSILEIRSRTEKFSTQSKALDETLKSATSALDAIRERTKHNLTERKKAEGEVGVLESKISKYREQMMAVKTNEEYKAMQKEIEFTQSAVRKVEDGILNLMEEAERLQADQKTADAHLKEEQRLVQEERKKLEQVHQQDGSAIESYLKERTEIEKTIAADLIVRYDRVRKARGGIAVGQAKDYMCEECQVRIRPQVFQEIRKNDKLISCDACQRILYFPENMDHPFEVA